MSVKAVKDLQTQLKRESKSFEAIQQGTIIALLNTFGFGFEFKRPERIAEKTLQFLIIVEVYYNQKPLEFGKKIDNYCDEQFQAEVDDKMSVNQIKSLKRRRDLNRAALSFNWLIEYVQQFGYMIERRSTKSAKKTLQMEKINKVYKRNGYYFTAAEIHSIGKEMNAYIIKQFVKIEKTAKLTEFNAFCTELIKKYDRRTIPQAPSQTTGEGEAAAKKEEEKPKEKETTEKKETKENTKEETVSPPTVPSTQPPAEVPSAPPTTGTESAPAIVKATQPTTTGPPTAPAVEVNSKESISEAPAPTTPMETEPLPTSTATETKTKEAAKKPNKVTPPAPKMDKKKSKKDRKKKKRHNHHEKKPQKAGRDSETVEDD